MSVEAINEFFGINGDTSGLEGNYQPGKRFSPEEIKSSYNPFEDDSRLREHPENFEQLRHDYKYREETETTI